MTLSSVIAADARYFCGRWACYNQRRYNAKRVRNRWWEKQSVSDKQIAIHTQRRVQRGAVLSGPISQQSHVLSQSNQPLRMCRDVAVGLLLVAVVMVDQIGDWGYSLRSEINELRQRQRHVLVKILLSTAVAATRDYVTDWRWQQQQQQQQQPAHSLS